MTIDEATQELIDQSNGSRLEAKHYGTAIKLGRRFSDDKLSRACAMGAIALTLLKRVASSVMDGIFTIELRGDPNTDLAIEESIKAIREGKVRPWSQVKQELGLDNSLEDIANLHKRLRKE